MATEYMSTRGCGSFHHMEVTIRPSRPGDGADLARGWLDGCRYYITASPPSWHGRRGATAVAADQR
jgi:hypothetical protein